MPVGPHNNFCSFCGSSNNSNKNTPPTKRYHDLPGSCVQRVFFFVNIFILACGSCVSLMWLKHNVECVFSFIQCYLSIRSDVCLLIDDHFVFRCLILISLGCAPYSTGVGIYLRYQHRNSLCGFYKLNHFDICAHAR